MAKPTVSVPLAIAGAAAAPRRRQAPTEAIKNQRQRVAEKVARDPKALTDALRDETRIPANATGHFNS